MERFIQHYSNFCKELLTLLPKDVSSIQEMRERLKEPTEHAGVLEGFVGYTRDKVLMLSQRNRAYFGVGQRVVPGVDFWGRWDKFSESTVSSLFNWAQVLWIAGSPLIAGERRVTSRSESGGGGGGGEAGEEGEATSGEEEGEEEDIEAVTRRMLEQLGEELKKAEEGEEGGGGEAAEGGAGEMPSIDMKELEELSGRFFEGTAMGEIAKDIISEILSGTSGFLAILKEIQEEMMSSGSRDPMRIIQRFMTGKHKGRLLQLVTNLTSRLKNKLKRTNITQAEIAEQLQVILERVRNDPEIGEMMRNAEARMGSLAANLGRGMKRGNKKKQRKNRRAAGGGGGGGR